MLKILYSAAENENSKIQLARFMKAIEDKNYFIKVAAYQKSSPKGMHIDWTLDSLKNIFKPDQLSLDSDNFSIYYEQVKAYNPDLIISDLEYFTSHIASVLGITLWQCSSSIINYALNNDYKYNLGIFKKYAYIFNKNPLQTQRNLNIIDISNCKFIYSHFGDSSISPSLKSDFEWIRPYHCIGKESLVCKHNVVAGTLKNNKKIISLLKNHSDSVCFSDFTEEFYDNPNIKDINNLNEFSCNLKNSRFFVCEGQTSFLADAFYNSKHSIVLTNFEDSECIINSTISEKLGLSSLIYQSDIDLNSFINTNIPISLNENVNYLHEKIMEI